MSLRRSLSREGIAHANADSPTHERHVKQRARLREFEWIPAVADENPASSFRLKAEGLRLGQGTYFAGDSFNEKEVKGEEFEKHCAAVNWERRWNLADMTRKVQVRDADNPGAFKSEARVSKVRRKRSTPACEEFVVNFSPWQMEFINRQLASWTETGMASDQRHDLLLSLLNDSRKDVLTRFESLTKRSIIGSYIHFDSNKVHVGIVHSRVGPDNTLVGEKTLGTVGPWTTAQNRIAKLGLVEESDHRLRENLEKFGKHNKKGARPLDIELHEALDRTFEKSVLKFGNGAERRFTESKEHYRKWKTNSRHSSPTRSSTSLKVAHETLRLLLPFLPPQIRAGISAARTAADAFRFLNSFLVAPSPPEEKPQLQPEVAL